VRRGKRSGLNTIAAVHSTIRGPSLGGCRMWSYDDSAAALRDALRLSRAMTFKAAVADLALGGGKGVIVVPAGGPLSAARRREVLLDFADTVDALAGAYITAEDVGTSSRDMSVIASRTRFVAGLSRRRGGSGDPSPWTALGVEAGIEASCERVFGTPALKRRTVCVVGLGHVGGRIAMRLARAGARLLVSDVDARKRVLATELGARWMPPAQAMTADVDVLAPCALGGVLDVDTVPTLRCPIVVGAANNQLAEDRVADLLAAAGVLWAPDFVVNAGGIINISVELDGPYDPGRARRRVRAIGETVRYLFDQADAGDATPLTVAMELARRRLVAAG
jgi:leucine dehydrogenase